MLKYMGEAPGPQLQSRYRLLRPLGKGGMGQVILAHDSDLNLPVALKFLHRTLPAQALRFFREEARLLTRLSHPNLVKIYDFFEDGIGAPEFPEGACISMEYVAGHIAEASPDARSPHEWMQLFVELAQGLLYLHNRRILHRDLKPSNVIVTPKGEAKILDFGLAALQSEIARGNPTMGTLAYMPPEAYWGEYDSQSDLFALGVLFFEALTGRLPFSRPLSQIGNPPPVPESLKLLRADLPDYFSELIHRLLELNPARRPRSCLSLIRFLNQHVDRPFPILDAESSEEVLRKAPLIGREAELKAAWEFWENIHVNTNAGVLALHGPTGIGRSRLLEEIKWKAQLGGESFFAVPATASVRWLDWLLKRVGAAQGEMGRDFFAQVDALLQNLHGKNAILAFPDLHDWDPRALQHLGILLTRAKRSKAGILFILEYDDDIATTAFEEWWAQREMWPKMQSVALGDLNEATTRQLIQASSLDAPLGEDAIQAIVGATGGRPLLVLEAVRHLLTRTKAGGDLHFEIPQSLREASALRVKELSEPGRRLLARIAVHQPPIAPSLFPALGASEETDDALREIERNGFLKKRNQNEPGLQLAHPTLRETYLENLPKEMITAAHRTWLDFLSAGAEDVSPRPIALQITEHALGATDVPAFKKWGGAAGDYCQRSGRDSRALELFHKLLDLAETPLERSIWNAHLAPVYYRLGRFQDSLDAYDRWFQDRVDDESFLQKLKHQFYQGLVYYTWGKNSDARLHFEAALAIGSSEKYPAHRPYHVRAYNMLAALEEKRGSTDTARELLKKALPLAQGMPLQIGEIEQRLGRLDQLQQKFQGATEHFDRSLRHYRETENRQAQAIAFNSLGMLHLETGDLQAALPVMQEAVGLAQKSGELLQSARYRENLALVLLEMGNFGDAQNELQAAEDILLIVGKEEDRLLMQIHRADLFLRLGNLDQATLRLQQLAAKRERLQTLGIWQVFLLQQAEWAYLTHRWKTAAELFRQVSATSDPRGKMEGQIAKFGWIRALQRDDGLSPECQREIDGLHLEFKAFQGAFFESWSEVLNFLKADTAALNEAALLGTLQSVKRTQRPENRMDIYSLRAQLYERRGIANLAQRLKLAAEAEFVNMMQSLPEELKMDFEKNRSLNSLDQALGDVLPTPAAESPPASASNKKNANDEAQISENRFRQYSEINRQIAQKTDLVDILERVMDAAIELTGAERGFLLLRDGEAQGQMIKGYTVKTARHLNQRSLGEEEFQFSMTAIQQAVNQGTYLLTDNAQLDPRFQQKTSVMQFQLKSILVVPLELEGQVLGSIYLDHRYQPNCFAPEDVTLLTAFASQAALAIQKAQMMEELRQAKEKLEVEVKDQARHIEVLSDELKQMRDQLRYEYKEIVGQSPAMMQVFQLLDHVTETTIPVWIWGESGTGKELIARSLHYNSPRKSGPFVTENCSSIPETLLESELFGHKKGSFTHADRDRIGLFEQAHGGTLFLDEIADMSLGMQAKLLRVLQEGEIRPIGGSKKIKVDVRLVTASNRDLNQMVKDEKYRQDLFFRINGMTIKLPPLRERKDDIPLLVDYMIKKISKEFGLQSAEVTEEAYQAMFRYPWPGNIRELEGVMRNALLFAKGRIVTPEILSLNLSMSHNASPASSAKGGGRSAQEEQSEERQMILEALKRNEMDKEKVAAELGISLRSLYTRLEKLGIPKKKTLLAKYLNLK